MNITVRPGDSLWYYSKIFNLPIEIIKSSNPSVSYTQIMIGQHIHIPGYILEEYTIKAGDTFWQIANRNHITVGALEIVNSKINYNQLTIGDKIYLPQRVTELVITDVSNYSYDKMLNDIKKLQTIYPFIRQQSIGKSVLNKDIIELQIGVGTKEVHANGSFHANEWITTPIIMYFLNQYALALTNNLSIRNQFMLPLFLQTTFSIVPMVNPDGVDLVINGLYAAGSLKESVLEINNENEDFSNWKANIRGVDLNNQFPALWEIEAERKTKTPQPRDYPGPYPLSEPEALAMAQLTEQRNFQRVNAFHTQGEEIYWGFEGLEPPISEIIVTEYARTSEYLPIQYVDSYAGYKDWFIWKFRKPGFTIELGKGVNPLPITDFFSIAEQTLGIFLANLYL